MPQQKSHSHTDDVHQVDAWLTAAGEPRKQCWLSGKTSKMDQVQYHLLHRSFQCRTFRIKI